MEYLPTDLEKFFSLNSQNPQVMNEHFFKSIAYQCINGLCFLHKLQIMHRDIKPSNIFYDDISIIKEIEDNEIVSFMYALYYNYQNRKYKNISGKLINMVLTGKITSRIAKKLLLYFITIK